MIDRPQLEGAELIGVPSELIANHVDCFTFIRYRARQRQLMNTAHSNERFFKLLDRFESCLETPAVPGELSDWFQETNAVLHEVAWQFAEQVHGTHTAILQDILNEDPELHSRVTEMREVDERLRSELIELKSKIRALTEYADQTDLEETQLHSQLESTIERGLKFVIDVRKQEHALTTWYMEAFERDRGIAD